MFPLLLVNYGKYPKNPSIFAMMGKYTSVTSYKIGICQIQKKSKKKSSDKVPTEPSYRNENFA